MLPPSRKSTQATLYNPDVAGSVTSGTLKKISSAADIVTLKLYYDLTVYTVTVENDGNGSASAVPVSATMGEKITLTSTPNSGYRFKEWQIVSGDVTISGDVFTMPAGNVVVKAVFERKSSDGSGRDSSSDRDTSSSAIRKDPIRDGPAVIAASLPAQPTALPMTVTVTGCRMIMAGGSVLRITAIRKAESMVCPAVHMLGNLSMAIGGHLTRMVMLKSAG